MKRAIPTLPLDESCREITIDTPMHNNLAAMADRRCGYIRRNLAYGNMTIGEIIAAAYIQGMTDLAQAIPEV